MENLYHIYSTLEKMRFYSPWKFKFMSKVTKVVKLPVLAMTKSIFSKKSVLTMTKSIGVLGYYCLVNGLSIPTKKEKILSLV